MSDISNKHLVRLKIELDNKVNENVAKFKKTLDYFIIFAFYVASLIFVYYGVLK